MDEEDSTPAAKKKVANSAQKAKAAPGVDFMRV
jgi:hypothetical protein